MFTGIVQNKLKVSELVRKNNLLTLGIDFPDKQLDGLVLGASVAINGVCLTVCRIANNRVYFDVISQTLSLTNLNHLKLGSEVNIERAARFSDEIGGHILSGHILTQSSVLSLEKEENKAVLKIHNTQQLKEYIFDKGYIGLNGCSLTIAEVGDDYFCVHLIPETLMVTTFGSIDKGDAINIEIDSQTQAIVETVKRVLNKMS